MKNIKEFPQPAENSTEILEGKVYLSDRVYRTIWQNWLDNNRVAVIGDKIRIANKIFNLIEVGRIELGVPEIHDDEDQSDSGKPVTIIVKVIKKNKKVEEISLEAVEGSKI